MLLYNLIILKLIVKIVTMYLDFGLNNLILDC